MSSLHRLCPVVLCFALGAAAASGQLLSETCLSPQLAFGGASGTPAMTTQAIVVTDNVILGDVHLAATIDHTWVGDIHLELVSPQGTIVVLQSGDGGNADDLDLIYADGGLAYGSQAFSFGCYMQPAGDGGTTMSDFAGENGLGTWTVQIADDYPGSDDGVLESLCLRLFAAPPAIPAPLHSLACNPTPDGSVMTWTLGSTYDGIDVFLDGVLTTTLPGTATTHTLTALPAGVQVEVSLVGTITAGAPACPAAVTIVPLGALPEPKTEKVVVVIIDGLRYSDGLGEATAQYVPNMAALAAQGTIIEPFLNDGVTITNRAIPAIQCGSWDPPTSYSDPTCNSNTLSSSRPTYNEYFRQQRDRPASDCQYILNPNCPWRGSFNPSYGPAYWQQWVTSATSDDSSVWSAAQTVLATDSPTLTTIYLPDVDGAGHPGNFGNYIAAIQTADQIVGDIWSWLQADPNYAGRTTMLVTNDHGRHWYDFQGHGDACVGCQTIQLLAIGPGVKSGVVSTVQRTVLDIAPTIGALLGFHTEYADGEVMTEILATCQEDIGLGGPGDATLSVCGGDLTTGTTATVRLVGGPVSGTAYSVASLTLQPTPIAGGTIIDPTPNLIVPVPTSPAGTVMLAGLPGGLGPVSVYLQMLFVDPVSVPVTPYVGFSNAVRIDFR